MEKTVENKQCKACNIKFEITDKDLEFYEKVSPVFNGKKYSIPTPTLCPDCRQQRRLSFRNERKLYKRKCDFSGKDIISIYSPDKQYKVYDQDIWWSDKWDVMDYGKDFDFNISFFGQFDELMKEVPKNSSQNKNSENCDYASICMNSNNCYLSNVTHFSEKVNYSSWIIKGNDSIDSYRCSEINNCYESINCYKSNSIFFSILCNNCNNCHYSYNLSNCNNCLLCSNLINKKYYINNKKYTKEEYFKIMSKYNNRLSIIKLLKKRDYIIKYKVIHNVNNNTSTEYSIGDYLYNSKNCINCFDIIGGEDCKNFWEAGAEVNKCYDCSYGWHADLCYENISASGYNNIFCVFNWESNLNFLSISCFNSSNLFGCIGLKNKQYCILNKQYTKEEYNILVPKIIEHMKITGEWGEFFPSSISPFGYNETVANEYFPIKKEEAKEKLFNWSDYETPFPKVDKIIPANKLPNNIDDIPDDILNWAIECEVTKKPFKIIKQELEFYRKHNLPIPRRHPDQRHLDRMKLRNPRKLFDRKCDKCKIDMKTTYSPDRPEIVYCEECYNKEVY